MGWFRYHCTEELHPHHEPWQPRQWRLHGARSLYLSTGSKCTSRRHARPAVLSGCVWQGALLLRDVAPG